MPRGVRDEPLAKTAERDAARAARNDRIQEVMLLVSWLTKWKGVNAHIAPSMTAGANSTMNYVICVHHGDVQLVWRASDFEVLEYFKHLKHSECGSRGLPRAEKMAYLAALAEAHER